LKNLKRGKNKVKIWKKKGEIEIEVNSKGAQITAKGYARRKNIILKV
jgi:hypothetical protein